jgi:RNA ligase partner protein
MATKHKKEAVILDTSLFVNPEVRESLGNNPTEALENFLLLAAQIPSLEFYMPPSIFEELLNFIEPKKISGDLLVFLKQKPPKKYEITIPALILYELIEDMRERINKGLRVTEKAVRGAAKIGEEEIIKDLRKKYREALREGIIDSKEDVDLILLARELDGLLVTADQGVIKWAEKLGITWLISSKFKEYLLSSIKKADSLVLLES